MAVDVHTTLSDLAYAEVTRDHLEVIVGRCLGVEAPTLTSVRVATVVYPYGSIATGALMRCSGTAMVGAEERRWSIFVKQLQSARVWPMLHLIPESHRADWVARFPWRIEIEAYRSRLPDLLPAGLRLPAVYDIVEIDDDRAAIWMEDVEVSSECWSTRQFAHAARLLGVLAGRRPPGTDVVFGLPPENLTPGSGLRMLAFGRVKMGVGGMLADDAIWAHSALVYALDATGERHLRDDIRSAMHEVDGWLDVLDSLPQTYVHGDASPQNLLVPVGDPDQFVVIDFGFNSPHCVGFDLGQLLVGLVHSDLMEPADMRRVHEAILPAYIDGLRSTGLNATSEEIERGFVLSLLVRSLFTAVPLEMLHEPDSPELRQLLTSRIRMARYLLNLADSV